MASVRLTNSAGDGADRADHHRPGPALADEPVEEGGEVPGGDAVVAGPRAVRRGPHVVEDVVEPLDGQRAGGLGLERRQGDGGHDVDGGPDGEPVEERDGPRTAPGNPAGSVDAA